MSTQRHAEDAPKAAFLSAKAIVIYHREKVPATDGKIVPVIRRVAEIEVYARETERGQGKDRGEERDRGREWPTHTQYIPRWETDQAHRRPSL